MAAKKQVETVEINRGGRPKYRETGGRTVEGGRAPKRTYRMIDEEYELVRAGAEAAGETIAVFTRQSLLSRAKKLIGK